MKILILANKLPYPQKDGGSIATFNLAYSLSKLGNEVHLLAINTSKHYYSIKSIPQDIAKAITFYDVFIDTKINSFSAILNLLFSSKPYNAVRFESKEFNAKLIELLENNKFDIVQLEGLYLSSYISTIKNHSKAKISMRSHNVEHELWLKNAKHTLNLVKRWYLHNLSKRLKKMEIKALNNYDALIPITKQDGAKFKSLGCNLPMHILPVGLELSNYKPFTDKIDFLSLFHIGALDWMPNQEGLSWFFTNVWPDLMQKFPDLKFYLAGRNAPRRFENKVKDISGVHYIGEVENAKEFMQSKAVMIVPLFSGSGMRVKIIEAMGQAKCIISTKIGAEGIPVTDNYNIIIADSPDEMIESISKVLQNASFFKQIGNNALNFVREHFDNNNLAKQLSDFYMANI